MISSIFGGSSSAQQLPRDIKEAVQKCRQATQDSLKDRHSRMRVNFPVGTQFGVEPLSKQQKRKQQSQASASIQQRSDRELARVFVEMFQPVGGENIVVVFPTQTSCTAAQKKWRGDFGASCQMVSSEKPQKKKTKSAKRKGFAAKMAEEFSDDGDSTTRGGPNLKLKEDTQVAIFVAPTFKEMPIIERISDEVGMGTLLILLNARDIDNESLDPFETVFCLTAAPQADAPGCLLYRTYKSEWILARKPTVGPPKTILVTPAAPTSDDCRAAYEGLDISAVERNVETAMENVANWLK